jgi:uncharacterized membrane protein (DUF4010 family)
MLAAVSGMTDVDDITLSLSYLSDTGSITREVAAIGIVIVIVIAASVNNFFQSLTCSNHQ